MRQFRQASLAVALALVAAGCSSRGSTARQAPSSPASVAGTVSSRPTAAPAVVSSGVALGRATFTSQTGASSREDQLSLAATGLWRDGQQLELDLDITCVTAGDSNQCHPSVDLHHPSENVACYQHSVYGLQLVDPVGLVLYRELLTKESCPRALSSDVKFVATGQTAHTWIRFPAPPPAATSVDLLIPATGQRMVGLPVGNEPAPFSSRSTPKAPPPPGTSPQPSDVGPTPRAGLTAPGPSTDGLTVRALPIVLLTEAADQGRRDAASSDSHAVTLASDVLFEFGKATLTAKARKLLAGVADQLGSGSSGPVAVTGYTDDKGTNAVNEPLSRRRADAVVAALKTRPTAAGLRYVAAGRGSADPVAPNTVQGHDDPAGRALNRRVTIVYAPRRGATTNATAPSSTPSSAPQPDPTPSTAPADAPVTYSPDAGGSAVDTVSVRITRVLREGQLLAVEGTVVCRKYGTSTACRGYDVLDGDAVSHTQLDAFTTVDGIVVRDPVSGRRFPVAQAEAVPMRHLASDGEPQLPVGVTSTWFAYVAAPPLGTATVDVLLPHGGPTLTSVRITG